MNIRMVTPLGVQEARERLPQILAGFAEHTASEPVVVGAYRRPQGVIMSVEEYEDLLAAREERDRTHAAVEALASVRAEGGEPSAAFLGDLQDAVAGRLGDDELMRRAIARHKHG